MSDPFDLADAPPPDSGPDSSGPGHAMAAPTRHLEGLNETQRQAVEITEGPFSDFSGTVEEVLSDKGKVKVSVSHFGRPTSVELDYLQLRGH